MGFSEKNEPALPIGSLELKRKIAATTGLECQQAYAENTRRRSDWRSERDSNRRYGRLIGYAVQIEPGLRPQSPENGNISNIRRRLSAISLPETPIPKPGDRSPIRKSRPLAGLCGTVEAKVSGRRTGWHACFVRLRTRSVLTDLTGLFWTKLCEKVSLKRSFGSIDRTNRPSNLDPVRSGL